MPMIPYAFLPAVAGAREALQMLVERFQRHAARQENVILLNPFAPHPGEASIPADSAQFRFWEIDDADSFTTFFSDFSIQLDMLDLPGEVYASAPLGYGVTRYALRFEGNCQFDSWLAVENVGQDDMRLVREYYRRAGLPEEAEALAKVEAAWYAAGGHPEGYDAADVAYASVQNPYSEYVRRWDYLVKFFANPVIWIGGEQAG